MGIRDIFASRSVQTVTAPAGADVAAALGPVTSLDSLTPFFGGVNTATREEAMSVPTVARGRNIICSSNMYKQNVTVVKCIIKVETIKCKIRIKNIGISYYD